MPSAPKRITSAWLNELVRSRKVSGAARRPGVEARLQLFGYPLRVFPVRKADFLAFSITGHRRDDRRAHAILLAEAIYPVDRLEETHVVGRPAAPGPQKLTGSNGAALGEARRGRTKTVIELSGEGREFGEWLADHLDEVHRNWLESNS